MRKGIIGLAVLATLGAGFIIGPPAQANPACITRAEFRHIRKGMTVHQVKHVVGSAGKLAQRSGPFMIRDFKTCVPFHVSNVSFMYGRESGKTYI